MTNYVRTLLDEYKNHAKEAYVAYLIISVRSSYLRDDSFRIKLENQTESLMNSVCNPISSKNTQTIGEM